MIRYFFRALFGHLRGGLSLFLLSLAGVAIGVAAVLSIQILNLSALGAFEGSMEAVSGDADASIVGRAPTMPEEIYADVLSTPGVRAAWPLYRIDVALAEDENTFVEIIGVDLFTPVEVPWSGEPVEVADTLAVSGWVAITPGFAAERGWDIGDPFDVTIGSRRVTLEIGALSDFQSVSPYASPRLAVMDISQAQSLLGRSGELHQIDVKIREGEDRGAVVEELQKKLGRGVLVLTPEQREQQTADLMGAFRLNLTALSLVSLFVGGFLVFSATQASLVRRRHEFGLLRSLGATDRQVASLLVGEVVLLALLGVAIGTPLGYLAAQANVDRVSATLSNLYLLEEIHRLRVPPWFYLMAAGVGLAGAGAGAYFPARELSRKDTRSLLVAFTLHEEVGERAPRLFLLGLLLLAGVGALYLAFETRWRPAGFVEAVGLLLAVPLMTPLVVQKVSALVRVRSLGFRYGLKGLGKQLQTTPVAIAALAIAVSMLVGITTMVSSFRETLEIWIQSTIRADIYVSTPSWRRARGEAVLEDEVLSTLSSHPEVAQVDRLRQLFVYTNDRRISLAGVDISIPLGEGRFVLLSGEPDEASRALERDGAVLIGEPLARKEGLSIGDELTLEGPDGPLSIPIAGVYYDYSSELGSAFMDMKTMERYFGPGPINNVALYLEDGADAERVVDELKNALSGIPIELRSNRRLREEVFRIFDQTFAITRLLQAMGLVIAVCGITLSLVVLARERVSELALYRALGAERHQIFRMFLGKGLGMAALGIGLGTAAGIGFALILIFVINRAYFGWTIALFWPVRLVAQQIFVILVAAALASIYPALIASATPATELRREDL